MVSPIVLMKNATLRPLEMICIAFACLSGITMAQTYDSTSPPGPVSLTPRESPLPHINGPKVFGVKPGHPIIFRVAATGVTPITFSADNLPPGLKIDPANGQLSGALPDKASYDITLHARNRLGSTSRSLK